MWHRVVHSEPPGPLGGQGGGPHVGVSAVWPQGATTHTLHRRHSWHSQSILARLSWPARLSLENRKDFSGPGHESQHSALCAVDILRALTALISEAHGACAVPEHHRQHHAQAEAPSLSICLSVFL